MSRFTTARLLAAATFLVVVLAARLPAQAQVDPAPTPEPTPEVAPTGVPGQPVEAPDPAAAPATAQPDMPGAEPGTPEVGTRTDEPGQPGAGVPPEEPNPLDAGKEDRGPTGDREQIHVEDCALGGKDCDNYVDFVKGELLTVGDTNLLGNRSRAGARLGYRAINHVHYGTVDPGFDLRFDDFHLGMSAPLNIEVWDGTSGLVSVDTTQAEVGVRGFENSGRIREQDWDTWHDYARVLRHVGYGRKEDFLYVNLSQDGAASIGHGLIMKRYMPQIDVDTVRVAAELDAYSDYHGGFEFYTNDVTRWSMLGLLGFIKPLAPFMPGYLTRSFSIGFTFVTDANAPRYLAVENRRFVLDPDADETLPLASETVAASIWGIDSELKVFKNAAADIKVYLDFSKMVDAGNGTTVGVLGRFNAAKDPVHAFRVRAEARSFSGNYEPSYFDSFYEIDKWQFLIGPNQYGKGLDTTSGMMTKYQAITTRNDERQFGYFVEAAYSVLGYVSVGAALESQSPLESYNMLLHLSIPWSDYLRLQGTYQKRHFGDFGKLFDFNEDNEWLSAMARLKLLPILFLNGQVSRLWSLNREVAEFGLEKGAPGPEYGLYRTGWDFQVWLDAAYEF